MSLSSSKSQPSVKVTRSRTSKVARIAKEIVDLVERTDGPVPLNRVDEEVSDFRASPGPSWEFFVRRNTGEVILWNGMTEEGCVALRQVLNERKVALQRVNALPYIIENVRLLDPNWQPVVLLPVRAANIDGVSWAFRVPPAMASQVMQRLAGDARYRPLIPRPVRATADDFCSGY
jgi:hypothetical protein